MRLLAVLLALICLPAVHAQIKPGAQTSENAGPEDTQSDTGPYSDPGRTLPYLAYTLGQLHYLAYACDGSETQEWRERMIELLRLEAPMSGYRRDRLIDAFNDGYQVEQRARIRCGAEAEAERRTLARRGAQMSQALLNDVLD